MSDKADTALELFASGFNCAQSVLAVFCEDYGLDRGIGLRLAGGMGGGFRSGEICGAVSGAVLVIGLKYGHSALGDKAAKDRCNGATIEFISRFKAKNGTVSCRGLLGYDISRKEEYDAANSGNLFKTICPDMIRDAIEILVELDY